MRKLHLERLVLCSLILFCVPIGRLCAEDSTAVRNGKQLLERNRKLIAGWAHPTCTLRYITCDKQTPVLGGYELQYTFWYKTFADNDLWDEFAFRFDRKGNFTGFRTVRTSAFIFTPGSATEAAKELIQEIILDGVDPKNKQWWRNFLRENDAKSILMFKLKNDK